MAIIDIALPQFGMGMQEGEIVNWLKAVGDTVTEGETIAEVEAAKATNEIPAPRTGTLTEIVVPEGETVEVRSVIARMEV